MKSFLKKVVLGATLGATALTLATPADAQRYRYNRYHHNGGGAAVAGIAGLAIGAALASSANDRYRGDYYRSHGYRADYDDYYYRQRGYYPSDGYYNYYYRNRGDCYTERRYDRYQGRTVKFRVCN